MPQNSLNILIFDRLDKIILNGSIVCECLFVIRFHDGHTEL